MSTTTTSRVADDQHGNPISAGEEAIDLYDRAVDRFARYHPDVVAHATTLAQDHPDVAMGQALVAYLHLSSTQRPDAEVARAAWQEMAATPMTARELAHHEAIGAWVRGSWDGAARVLDDLLLRWPTDLLALLMGHQLDFFVGDAANLRDRPGRSLAAFAPITRTPPSSGACRRSAWRSPGTTRPPRRPGWQPCRSTPTTSGRSMPSPTPMRCAAWCSRVPGS